MLKTKNKLMRRNDKEALKTEVNGMDVRSSWNINSSSKDIAGLARAEAPVNECGSARLNGLRVCNTDEQLIIHCLSSSQ